MPRRPALSFLRGFSAPVRVEDDLTEDDLIVLSRRDGDNFNRWQALQSLATRVLLRGVKAIRAGRAPERNAGLIAAFGALIEDARAGRVDPAFAALAMTLPSESDIAREIGEDVDPDAIYSARKALRGALGRKHGDALVELHRQLADPGPFNPDAAAAGRRALRNGALALFVDGNVIDGLALAHGQLREADNMAERLGALAAIAFKPSSTREHTLDAFGRRYAMEPLILDKWFALQAHIPERETLERVRALMSHRGFSMSNPNRVRALIGGFSANHTQFNRADGGGFALLEEVVVALDPANPQIAARLLTAMRSWRSLEESRRRQAEAMLEKDRRATGAVAGHSRHRDPYPRVGSRQPAAADSRPGFYSPPWPLPTAADCRRLSAAFALRRNFAASPVKGLDKDSHKDSYRTDSEGTAGSRRLI